MGRRATPSPSRSCASTCTSRPAPSGCCCPMSLIASRHPLGLEARVGSCPAGRPPVHGRRNQADVRGRRPRPQECRRSADQIGALQAVSILKKKVPDAASIKRARDLYKDIYSKIAREDADGLVADYRAALGEWQNDLKSYVQTASIKHHPGKDVINAAITRIGKQLAIRDAFEFIETMLAAKSDWLDTSEDIHDVVSFYKTQLPTWYAPQARKDFIAAVTARANLLGLSRKAARWKWPQPNPGRRHRDRRASWPGKVPASAIKPDRAHEARTALRTPWRPWPTPGSTALPRCATWSCTTTWATATGRCPAPRRRAAGHPAHATDLDGRTPGPERRQDRRTQARRQPGWRAVPPAAGGPVQRAVPRHALPVRAHRRRIRAAAARQPAAHRLRHRQAGRDPEEDWAEVESSAGSTSSTSARRRTRSSARWSRARTSPPPPSSSRPTGSCSTWCKTAWAACG
jgi:hypothetical protein